MGVSIFPSPSLAYELAPKVNISPIPLSVLFQVSPKWGIKISADQPMWSAQVGCKITL